MPEKPTFHTHAAIESLQSSIEAVNSLSNPSANAKIFALDCDKLINRMSNILVSYQEVDFYIIAMSIAAKKEAYGVLSSELQETLNYCFMAFMKFNISEIQSFPDMIRLPFSEFKKDNV